MTILVNGKINKIEKGSTLADAVCLYSPFGSEPALIKLNGIVIDENKHDCILQDGDHIELFPLFIGG